MNIRYSTDKKDIDGIAMHGFFDGWPNKPSKAVLQKSIENASKVVLAIDPEQNKLIGYITAITNGVLAAYIPFLEVEATYRGKGIGKTLVAKMLEKLNDLYMVDVVCDTELAGLKPWHAMIKRDTSAIA